MFPAYPPAAPPPRGQNSQENIAQSRIQLQHLNPHSIVFMENNQNLPQQPLNRKYSQENLRRLKKVVDVLQSLIVISLLVWTIFQELQKCDKEDLLQQTNSIQKAIADRILELESQFSQKYIQLEKDINDGFCNITQPNSSLKLSDVVKVIADQQESLNIFTTKFNQQINQLTIMYNALEHNTDQQLILLEDRINSKFNEISQRISILETSKDSFSISQLTTNMSNLNQNLTDLSSKYTADHQFILQNTSDLSSLNSTLIKQQNNYDAKFNSQDQINKIFQSNQTIFSSKIDSITNNQPARTFFYKSYKTNNWIETFATAKNQIVAHPTAFQKITIDKKSKIFFIINGHFISSVETFITILKDKVAITLESIQNPGAYYDSFLYYKLNTYNPVNFIQEVVIEPGTYLFEIGFSMRGASTSSANGFGLSIDVQELFS